MPECERCGSVTDKLYEFSIKDEDDETITKKLCWDCDHDVTNGGDFFEDSWEILQDRGENEYAFDPINNPRPW